MSDLEISLAISLIGVATWTAAVILDGHKTPLLVPGMVLALSFVAVSWLSLSNDPIVPMLAAFNRGLVAGVGFVIAVDRWHRRRQRQRARER